MLSVGDTFLIPTPPRFNAEHLFIIIAIEKSSHKALMVNVTSYKEGCDGSCILNVGEHPFLTHRSVINYADARITTVGAIEESLKQKFFKIHEPVSSDLLKKIQQGGLNSPAVSLKCQYFLTTNL